MRECVIKEMSEHKKNTNMEITVKNIRIKNSVIIWLGI